MTFKHNEMMSIAMDFDEVVKRRKMIRDYDLEKQIPNEIITKLIKNAHKAPSAGHTQVQEFIIVKDVSIKKKLRKAAVNQEYVAVGLSIYQVNILARAEMHVRML